jgi:hypothetical protein
MKKLILFLTFVTLMALVNLVSLVSVAVADTRSPLYLDSPQSIGNSDDGSGKYGIHVLSSGTFSPPYSTDTIVVSSTATTDVYAYKFGGTGGTLLRTTTITYTDSTKATLSSITKVDSL